MSGLAEEEYEQSPMVRWLRIGGGLLLAAALIVLAVYMLKNLVSKETTHKKQVTKINILPDAAPPPPPPPPPKEEIKPKDMKEIKVEQPKPAEAPQPAEQIKMEGPAGDGASPFQAGPVTSDYQGGPVIDGGAGGGGNKMQFAFFSKSLQRHLQDELARNRKVKLGDYKVTVNVWISSDGTVRKAELMDSSGNAETDRALRIALAEIGPLRTAIPEKLPQPITLRITNRMIG